jgi:undecaprenyl phosphate-alpha-L-ara4FN deformylase
MKIGLRVDVDTFRGTRDGVPNLLKIFADNRIRATFFFSVGPDNMGRHLWRLARPAFFVKMLRSKAGKLYGWDILLRGTLWPGSVIGKKLKPVIRSTAAYSAVVKPLATSLLRRSKALGYEGREAGQEGHEIGLHAWDHHKWQAHIDKMDSSAIRAELERAFEMLSEIIGAPSTCSAVPGWKCTNQVLIEKQRFPFAYNSDCRGFSVFLPVVDGKCLSQPQVPVTLPTYDEVVGSGGVTPASFGDYVISQLRPDKLNVLTIHAEVEGIAIKDEFTKFVQKTIALGHEFCPLSAFISGADSIPAGMISAGTIPGREGWVSVQGDYK